MLYKNYRMTFESGIIVERIFFNNVTPDEAFDAMFWKAFYHKYGRVTKFEASIYTDEHIDISWEVPEILKYYESPQDYYRLINL
jgi:hypothetical protein